jgi:hypothetical protein
LTQLIDKAALAAHEAQAATLLKRSLKEAAERAKARAVTTRRLSDPDWWPEPFSFERDGDKPGKESPTGKCLQYYDEQKRLILRELSDGPRTGIAVYEHEGEQIDSFYGSHSGDSWETRLVGRVGRHGEGVSYSIRTDPWHLYQAWVWRTEQGRVVEIQDWVHDGIGPSITLVEYDADGKAAKLINDGELIWPKPKRRRSEPIPKAAAKILAAVRKALPQVPEPVLALTLSYFSGDVESSVPPVVNYVLKRDADDYLRDPSKHQHGLWQIWGTKRAEPLAGFKKEQIRLEWTEEELEEKLGLLVDAVNAQRQPGEPPFVLVDFHGAPEKHFDRIPDADRAALEPYLKR